MARKIAAVVQRYGHDFAGGENLARQVLQRLAHTLDITVLTTCARDYVSWANHYTPGTEADGPLIVRRFPVVFQRPRRLFDLLSALVLHRRLPEFTLPCWLEEAWVTMQGPYCPALVDYIRDHREAFDAFVFYTYLYYPTVRGLPLVRDKAILVPTAHDERPIYLRSYRKVFEARRFVFLSQEEQEFVNRRFPIGGSHQRVASMQVPTPDPESLALSEFEKKHGINKPYLLFLGRVDVAKGAQRMFDYFLRYLQETLHPCILVLAGDLRAEIPVSASIRYLGFLNEAEKQAAIIGSQAVLLFSPYESFSISVLEAMGLGRPVIVTAESPVLKGHVERSGAGFAVSSYGEFRAAVRAVFAGREDLGRKGILYVKENFSWETVERAYLELIDQIQS